MAKACPVTRAEFLEHAKPMTVTINGNNYTSEARQFSTKSLGWNINGKTTVEINGKVVSVQIGLNLTVVGSKELPD